MGYFLFAAAIMLGFLFKNSKLVTVCMAVVMVFLSAFRYRSADLDNYILNYKSVGMGRFHFKYAGHMAFMKIWSDRGLNFEQYMIVFYIMVVFILIVSIRLLTDRVNEILAYYCIYSFALDVIQMKTFMAEVFSLLSIVILLKIVSEDNISRPHKTISMIISAAAAIIAVFMHFSSLYYLFTGFFFIFWRNRSKMQKRIFRWIFVSTAFAYVVSVLLFANYRNIMGNIIMLAGNYANALGILGDVDYLSQWTENRMRFGFVLPLGLIFMVVYASFYAASNKNTTRTELQININHYMVTACFMIPLLMINVSFFRLVRVYMILMYIGYANRPKEFVTTKKGVIGYIAFYGAIMYGFLIDIYPVYDSTLGAILKYNSIFSKR